MNSTVARIAVSHGIQPMLEVVTGSLAETEEVDRLIWGAMLRRTPVPDRSCAPAASNERDGGRQRYLFGPWVDSHLDAIATEVEDALSGAPAPPAPAPPAPAQPVMPRPAVAASPPAGVSPVTASPAGVSVVAGAVPVIGSHAAPAPGPVLDPAPAPAGAAPAQVTATPSPAANWAQPEPSLSEQAAIAWTMPLEVQIEMTRLRHRVEALEGQRAEVAVRVRSLAHDLSAEG